MYKTYIITDDITDEIAKETLKDFSDVVYMPLKTEDEIIENCKDADFLITLYEPITKYVLDNLPKLKVVSLISIGYNTVDVNYANEIGVKVVNNPSYCVLEVADHTSALILNLARNIDLYNRDVKENNIWAYDNCPFKLRRMSKQTLGLLGFGNIAKCVAKRIEAFGTNIIAYDPYIKSVPEGLNVKLVSKEELYKNSDIISIHMPLTDETKHMINYETFKSMEKQPIIINCSRGEIIIEDDLIKALDEELIKAVGLDVLNSETPDLENYPLLKYKNVIVTPHCAFYSEDSFVEADERASMHILYFIKNEFDKIPFVK